MSPGVVLSCVAVASLLVPQSPTDPQPRDARRPAAAAGTASISGRVTSAESGAPVRRVIVNLMPMLDAPPSGPAVPPGVVGGGIGMPAGPPAAPPPGGGAERPPGAPHTAVTDTDGRFEFTEVPAGSYRVRVNPAVYNAHYLPLVYGARRPGDAGTPIEVRAGERKRNIDMALLRGGAITGRVVDDAGEPLTRVMVYAARPLPGTGQLQRTGMGLIQSDDHGRYRVYGLEPGEYLVAAEARGMMPLALGGGQGEGFATTYHPAALLAAEATRVSVRAGADTDGIDIMLRSTAAFRISGTVVDSQGRPVERPQVALARTNEGGGSTSFGAMPEPGGRFVFRDVIPGEYVLVVRPSSFARPGGTQRTAEYATLPVTVNADIDNIVLMTRPAISVSGTVVSADGELPPATGLRISTQADMRVPQFGPPPSSAVREDYRFTLEGASSPLLIRAMLPRAWALKAVMLGATDITDTPTEFRREHDGQLQVIVTNRTGGIEGTVTGEDGKPVDQVAVLVFPEDKQSWRIGSPRVRNTFAGASGKFTVAGLLPGRYFAIAANPRALPMRPDLPAEVFERLAKLGTAFVIAEGERRVMDLRASDD